MSDICLRCVEKMFCKEPKYKCYDAAISILQAGGFTRQDHVLSCPGRAKDSITDEEQQCINFLCKEWGYGWKEAK